MTLALILLGTFISIFERFMSAQNKSDFDFKVFISKNWALFILHILTSLSLYFALFSGEIQDQFIIKGFDATNTVVLITGAISLYIWKALISVYKFVFDKILKGIKK